ncbi:hypothetical protein BC830DRAFT_1088496 [Chytriomyces sp. MP71]|nr:hypothetical protein BC830DRAFT_1088496 [Chytriomyces sp. MP71]
MSTRHHCRLIRLPLSAAPSHFARIIAIVLNSHTSTPSSRTSLSPLLASARPPPQVLQAPEQPPSWQPFPLSTAPSPLPAWSPAWPTYPAIASVPSHSSEQARAPVPGPQDAKNRLSRVRDARSTANVIFYFVTCLVILYSFYQPSLSLRKIYFVE